METLMTGSKYGKIDVPESLHQESIDLGCFPTSAWGWFAAPQENHREEGEPPPYV